MAIQSPRVNALLLQKFVHRTVRILGNVTAFHGNEATIDASGPVILHLAEVVDARLELNKAVEVIGKVREDLSLVVYLVTPFGDNINFATAEAVVDATHRFKEIFYTDS